MSAEALPSDPFETAPAAGSGVSRRRAIQAGAVGAGALWIAPTILGLDTPAAAGSLTAFVAAGGVSNTSGSGSVTAPSSGTFFVLLVASQGSAAPVVGAGWTAIPSTLSVAAPYFFAYYRSGAPATVSVSTGAVARSAVQLAFTGATSASATAQTSAAASPVTAPALTGGTGIYIFAAALVGSANYPAPPTSFTERVDSTPSSGAPELYAATSNTTISSVGVASVQTSPPNRPNIGLHIAVI